MVQRFIHICVSLEFAFCSRSPRDVIQKLAILIFVLSYVIRDVQCKKTQVICDVDHNTSRQDPGAWTKLAVSFPNQTSASRQRTFSYASTSGFRFHQQEQHSFSWMKLSLAGIHSSSKKGELSKKIQGAAYIVHISYCVEACVNLTGSQQPQLNKTKPNQWQSSASSSLASTKEQ